ncbi:oxidoreductase [Leptospira wolffii]|uniref:Oxidoreductase n=1 Tax=Leptospira wolffii TaxID=409998 RepID=A0A2M9ZG62_9LEPT|nr:oxidoreductase [Leptospira wolffii]PJZ67403.1 oxidoreductase [Leptospira wolffii]TGK62401.1 oxidoreductase [Leptospira wolffii]TGK70659.1 oxidoreductase [Leptospira wolffii]TGK74215.1 oxidoreductase [Leptospira wolffii]TGL32210.1 oxidoreductase [Leptospira wolffii]
MFTKPFLLQPRTVKETGNRRTVLDEPYTLFPDGDALLLKDFPVRVKVGDHLYKQKSGIVLSPVNGIASLEHGDEGTKIRIVQDGNFIGSKPWTPKSLQRNEVLETMDRLGLVSLDFPDLPLSSYFSSKSQVSLVILSPFSRTQEVDYLPELRKNADCHRHFLEFLKLAFPNANVRDYISGDSKIPIKNFAYPWGIPEYFVFKTEKLPFAAIGEVLYLGPETLYNLYRALFADFPFIEREIGLYFLGKNGGVRRSESTLRIRNGQSLKFLFEEYGELYPKFTVNSFYDQNSVRESKKGFYWDIRQHYSLIFLSRHESDRKEFPCVECGECSLNCPTKANPMALVSSFGNFQAGLCMECGICTFLCPSSISLRDRIRNWKEANHGF